MLETTGTRDELDVRVSDIVHPFVASVLAWRTLPLAIILSLQSLVALAALRNSAFQDEALYLYAGRQLLAQYLGGPTVTDPFATYLSGHPDVYPLIAGTLDAIGGVMLARLLSLVAMLIATACVYWIGAHIFTREITILGTATFALQGTVIFLSRLATYDAMCLSLLAIAIVLGFRSSLDERPWRVAILGPVLVLGFFAKYVFLLWTPTVFAVVALVVWRHRGLRAAFTRVLLLLASTAVTAALAVALAGPPFIHALLFSTLARQSSVTIAPVPRPALLWEVISYGGIELGLGIAGAFAAPKGQRLLAWLFVASSLLAPAYHVAHAEPVSLTKHLAFGMVFAAPLAGLAIQRLAGWLPSRAVRPPQGAAQWMVALPIFLIIFTLGLRQAQTLYEQWPNSAQMVTVMRSLVRPNSGIYLAEDMEVNRFYLQDVSSDWQWTGPFWFEYKTKQGQMLYGTDAYKQAINDGYFSAVELSFGTNPALDSTLKAELTNSQKYDLVARIYYKDAFGGGYYYIWRLRAPGSSAPPK